MEAKELKDALAELGATIDKKNEERMKAIQEKAVADVKALNEQIAELKESKADVQKHLDELSIRLKDVKAGADKQKSFGEQVTDNITAKKNDLVALKNNRGASASFDVKAAATMTSANYSGGTVGLTSWDPEFLRVVRRFPFLRQIVSVRPIGSQGISWAEQASPDGGAGMTAEGAAKSLADFDWVERRETARKITAYIKASKESLDDLPGLAAEINTELVELIALKLDDQLYNGDNTGQNLKGIVTYAPTFSVVGSPLAGGVGVGIDKANRYDVIRAAAWQVANSGKGKFVANYVALNPADAAVMDMAKDSNGQYIIPPFATAGGQTIAGIKVIENVGVTSGDFLLGDFSKSTLGIREDININIGYENDDFTKNLITILAEMRAFHYIKTNNNAAFVKGTFTTAMAAMLKS